MLKQNYLLFIFSLFSLLIISCAQPKIKKGSEKNSYRPLSEEEAKRLTTPTVYFVPQYDIAAQTCSANDKKNIKDRNGKVLISVCTDIYKSCLMQGTCVLRSQSEAELINVGEYINGEYVFSKVTNTECRYGHGARSDKHSQVKEMCLDPFYSVAADLSIYKLGDVIYIPSAVGLELPDGSLHDGYFIVRDSGGDIRGYGRFDFFTGFNAPQKQINPFAKVGLADKEHNVPYFVVAADEASLILKKRNYPLLVESK